MLDSYPRLQVTLRTGVHIANWHQMRRYRPALTQQVRADTILPNPAYLEALRLGRKGWGVPRHIVCGIYDESSHTLTLPMGYFRRLVDVAGDIMDPVVDERVRVPMPTVTSRIQLRDYQRPAVEAMVKALKAFGVALLEAPPGAGKTEMGLEIAAQLDQRTLWLTHTLDLANQVRQRAVARLGIPESSIGMLGAGKREIGPVLTIGLIPTLARMDLRNTDLPWQFGTVVLDECHHSPATTWARVLSAFAAFYRFGVTGTLERRDGLETITRLYFGPTTYKIERHQVQVTVVDDQAAGVLPTELRTLQIRGEEYIPKAWTDYVAKEKEYQRRLELWQNGRLHRKPRKPKLPYTTVLNELLANEHRNRRILELLSRIAPGRRTLVLSARIDHCRLLEERLRHLRPQLRVATVHGQQPAVVRDTILQRARDGDLDVLFSVAIAKEGLDLPILDQLVFVAAGRDPLYLKQAIGRIQRTHPGKSDCVVWDIVDQDVGVLRAQWWARRRVYMELGMVQPRERKRQAALVTA